MQNSGPSDPWLPVVENSRLFAQRTVRPLIVYWVRLAWQGAELDHGDDDDDDVMPWIGRYWEGYLQGQATADKKMGASSHPTTCPKSCKWWS